MKEIKEAKVIEEIIGYEAIDGTQFRDKEECRKYEETARVVIRNNFKQLVIKEMEGYSMRGYADPFPLSGTDEDWYYALVEIKDENDLRVAQMYHEQEGSPNGKYGFDRSMIGKRVIVSVGEGVYPVPESGRRCVYDNCYVFGTIDNVIKAYEDTIRKLEEIDEGGN